MGGDTTCSLVAVTGSQVPYIFDLPHVLSLPNGFEFRFRYRPQWVSDELQLEIDDENKAKALVGQRLLILFHSQETSRLIPLRVCEVLSLERLGPVIFLRFKVNDFFSVSAGAFLGSSASRQIEVQKESARLTDVGLKWLGSGVTDLASPLPDGLYLFRTKERLSKGTWTRPKANAWAAVAALVMGEPHLNSVPLFYLLGFQSRNGKSLTPSHLRGSFTVSKERISGYKLVEGQRYRLRLLEWRNQAEPPYRVVCDVSPTSLRVEGKSDLVVGKYDVLEFAVMAERRGYSEVLLRVEATKENGHIEVGSGMEEWPNVYTARVPIMVRDDRAKVTRKLIAAPVGFLLYAASTPIAAAALRWGVDFLSVPMPAADLAGKAVQVVGLALMFVAFGDFLERILGVGEKVQGFAAPTVKSGVR